MERMSTRRRGERGGGKAEDKAPVAAAPAEEKPPPQPAAEAAAELPAPPASSTTQAPEASTEAASSSAPAPPAPAPAAAAAAASFASTAPRPKRAKTDTNEENSWGEEAPAPIGITPQPLLPMRMVAGTGNPGFQDGPCANAFFRGPTGVALGADGCLYVADADNRRLRKIARKPTPDGEPAGERRAGTRGGGASEPFTYDFVTTVAGSGHAGIREGRARDATLCDPNGLAVDAEGNVFIADSGSHTLRRLSKTGEITLLAGCGKPGYADGSGAQAAFEYP